MLEKIGDNSLYKLTHTDLVDSYIFSHEDSRRICNDPFVYGIEYTELLKNACRSALTSLGNSGQKQEEALVLHLLRGGLNFCLREALAGAYSWNSHSAAFLSAQRKRKEEDSERWHIVEDSYRKVYLPKVAHIYLGDVVATGTSLKYGLEQLLKIAKEQHAEIASLTFFTIGGPASEEIVGEFSKSCHESFTSFSKSRVIYLEGRFGVAQPNSKLSVKLTGTDLLRSPADMAPEFIESQYESPSYPLERCTIYDAGSRAFWVPEYLEDVKEYWEQNLQLAQDGMSYNALLKERVPELDVNRFGEVSLEELCLKHLDRLK